MAERILIEARNRTLDDLVDFVVARILDQLGLENALVARWGQS